MNLLLDYPQTAYEYGENLICAKCGNECEWERCYAGCEDGYFDGYEEDPLWYDVGDLVPCHECGGRGGMYWCDNCGLIQRITTHKSFL